MLANMLPGLSVWFLLAVVVALLAGKAISGFPKTPSPDFDPPLKADWEVVNASEWEEEAEGEEMMVLAHAGPTNSR